MQALNYKDVYLLPSYSTCESRSKLDTSVNFCGYTFDSCVVPANMKPVIDFKMAEKLDSYNYFYILHRFYDYQEILDWIKDNQDLNCISISVGVKDIDRALIDSIKYHKLRVDFITIDIASGHNILMKQMITYIKNKLSCQVIAGNIGTIEAALDLQEWKADALKLGLGFGKSCCTYNCTGVGTPMFSTALEMGKNEQGFLNGFSKGYSSNLKIPVIADGGIREIGDICKALVAGASLIMIGSEFAKCVDSPAETKWNDKTYKVYFGSASATNKGNQNFIEGWDEVLLPCNGLTYLEYYKKIQQGIQSCMSYAGVEKIKNLNKMKWEIYTK